VKNKNMKKWLAAGLALILCGVPVQLSAVSQSNIKTIAPKEKISDSVYHEIDRLKAENAALAGKKIPVWVWYKDIDQKQVDREATKETGLSRENLSVEFSMPEQNVLNAIKQEELGGKRQMQQYLERTAAGRKLEAQRTDKYVQKRRALSRRKYEHRANDIADRISLTKNDIQYKSKYTPSIIAKMTYEEIKAASQCGEIEEIFLYQDFTLKDCSFEEQVETLHLNKVYSDIGLSGQGVKIGMIEQGVPYETPNFNMTNVTLVGNNLVSDGHALNTAKILKGKEGFAKNISLYATGGATYSGINVFSNMETLVSLGINVINMSSFFAISDNTTIYGSVEKWADHLAAQHSVLLICSAGNYDYIRILAPARSYNTVAVGAYRYHLDVDDKVEEDTMYNYSYMNEGGCKKPDVIAPIGSTSEAAPIVTGIAALLLELKPSLGYQPQTLKAILLASCQRKVKSVTGVPAETMEQGLTERQGAGAIDAWNAVCIVAQGNYGYGEVTSATEKRSFVQPSYGASHMNVSIAWLRENTISSSNHASGAVTAGTQHDLDLRVYRNGTQVGSSANANSSTEMAYFPLSASEARYQIRVSKEDSTNLETVRYGYAYSTDNMAFRENLTGTGYPEGIYYIRGNANASGAYLTVDEQTGQISQKAFTGAANQQWVSSKKGYDPFTIQTNSSAYPGYLSISGQTSAWVRQDSAQYITYGGNGFDNTYGIQLYGLPASNSRSLTALDTSVQSSTAIWQNIGIPERFQWYFEPVGYIRGDVNRDGTVSNADVRLAQNYVNKLVNLDAAQKFLGDMNNDGQVNINDVNLIQQAVSAG